MFRKPTSVDGVLAAFNKTLTKLHEISDAKLGEAADAIDREAALKMRAAEARADAEAAETEATRARDVAFRIRQLIGTN